ncbi:oocyte zinc finger -like [Pelobates cultripes]|uniref:Oocyte zinc finger -like n=1 Tax=Pelobates cultripes TaxID=61616 RepID=A0AAD1TAW7_PELCU|nr:oocyte zinc finger -like [Pelobates cultripes]
MNKDTNQVTEIMDITLKIIYLLTGEDYIFEKMPGDQLSHINSLCSTQSPNTVPPLHERNNEQNLLELTNKITHLLTGEVWQYLEWHRNLHKDVMTETYQPCSSPDESVGSDLLESFHTTIPSLDCLNKKDSYNINLSAHHTNACRATKQKIKCIVKKTEELASSKKGKSADINICANTEHVQKECPATLIKEESVSCKEGNLTDQCPATEHTHTDYTESTQIKKDPVSSEEGNHTATAIYTPTEHTQTELPFSHNKDQSCQERNHTDIDIYTTTEQTQSQYPSTQIKEELASCEEGNLSDTDIYTPAEQAQTDCWFHSREYSKGVITSEGNKILNVTKCSDCSINFNNMSVYAAHLRTHAMESIYLSGKPFSCTECNRCFYLKTDLIRHMRTHTGEKPFFCCICEKTFTRKSALIIHQRTHTGDKPFLCSVCGKCFAQKSTLVLHQRIHTGEKPFACSVCGKLFAQSSNLLKHKKIHTLEDNVF